MLTPVTLPYSLIISQLWGLLTYPVPLPSPGIFKKRFAETLWEAWGFLEHELPSFSLHGPTINLSPLQTWMFWCVWPHCTSGTWTCANDIDVIVSIIKARKWRQRGRTSVQNPTRDCLIPINPNPTFLVMFSFQVETEPLFLSCTLSSPTPPTYLTLDIQVVFTVYNPFPSSTFSLEGIWVAVLVLPKLR